MRFFAIFVYIKCIISNIFVYIKYIISNIVTTKFDLVQDIHKNTTDQRSWEK